MNRFAALTRGLKVEKEGRTPASRSQNNLRPVTRVDAVAARAAQQRCTARMSRRRGFTLIETALATVIIGVGVLAIVAAQQAFHAQNSWSTNASIALRLGNEIREMTLNLPHHDPVTGAEFWGPEPNESSLADFDDLDDFDGNGEGFIFSAALGNGPVNANRAVIPDMAGWSQTVRSFNVDPFNITSIVSNGSSNMTMVEVEVAYQGPYDNAPRHMTTVSWIAPK